MLEILLADEQKLSRDYANAHDFTLGATHDFRAVLPVDWRFRQGCSTLCLRGTARAAP